MGSPGRRSVRLLTVLVLFAVTSGAQETWNYKGEAYTTIGTGRFYNGDDHWGNGLEFGGGFGFRPVPGILRSLGVELRAHRLDFSRQPSATHSYQGNASSIASGFLWHFSNSGAQPYVVAELGAMRTNFTLKGISDWYEGNPDGTLGRHHVEARTEKGNDTHFLFGLGAGMKIRVSRQLYVRPELRLDTTTPGRGRNFETFRLALGCGYHW